jgi:hypothetical protein
VRVEGEGENSGGGGQVERGVNGEGRERVEVVRRGERRGWGWSAGEGWGGGEGEQSVSHC